MNLTLPISGSRALLQLLASGFTVWAGFTLLGTTHSFLFIWPLTAVQVWIALADWRDARSRTLQLLACWVGHFAGARLLGMPVWIGTWRAAVQILEVACVVATLYPAVQRFDDLKKRQTVLRLCFAAFVVPLFTVALAAKPISGLTHVSLFQSWLIAAPSDCLGVAAILPALLLLSSRESWSLPRIRHNLRLTLPIVVLFLTATVLVFAQDKLPLLFLVFPPLVILVFVTGLEGATVASLAVTVIAGWASEHGHGPVWLAHGLAPEMRILLLQLFLATVVAVALPVGALLDEEQIAARRAWEGQSIYKTLIEHAEDMILLSTLDGERRFVSPAVEQVTGWSQSEYLGLGDLGWIHPDDHTLVRAVLKSLAGGKLHHSIRYRVLCKGGDFRWVEALIRGYCDSAKGRITGYVATVRDISEHKENEDAWTAERAVLASQNQHLSDLALKDELTGIANRRAFNLLLDYEFRRHVRSGMHLSLLMIDVDFFKNYNDTFGHPAGDRCLRLLAQTIGSCVRRSNDRVARVGGEEFAALMPDTDEAGARKVAQTVLETVLDLQIPHPGSTHRLVTVSIGIATLRPHLGVDVSALWQHADRALYASKQSGRNRISFVGEEPVPERAETHAAAIHR